MNSEKVTQLNEFLAKMSAEFEDALINKDKDKLLLLCLFINNNIEEIFNR